MPYPFELPDLGYDYDAVEPRIDARTMQIHHGKHHAGYTSKLNAALEGHPSLHGKSAEQILRNMSAVPEAIRGAVQNNGGGYVNHTLFWQVMAPGGGAPSAALAEAIGAAFGSVDDLTAKLKAAAGSRFGSGWGWLVVADGGLQVYSTANQDSPYMNGHTPILGVDVWEHAYYLNYQNRRPDYLDAFGELINWSVVSANYARATGG